MAATKIAIVGAGLGGLAAALFLRRAELNVVVYEQSTALHEIGAGIVVPPNMVRLLRRLDLAKKLDEFAVRTRIRLGIPTLARRPGVVSDADGREV